MESDCFMHLPDIMMLIHITFLPAIFWWLIGGAIWDSIFNAMDRRAERKRKEHE